MSLPDTIVKLRAGRETCTGFLIDAHTVITAAHFLRGKEGRISVIAQGKTYYSKAYKKIDATDVAVVRLQQSVKCERYYPIAATNPRLLAQTHTIGFRGKKSARSVRGRYLCPLFFSTNTTFETRIRRAGIVFSHPPALPGDSGGPVFCEGEIVGIQSLVFNLGRWNLGVATISMLPSFKDEIEATQRLLASRAKD